MSILRKKYELYLDDRINKVNLLELYDKILTEHTVHLQELISVVDALYYKFVMRKSERACELIPILSMLKDEDAKINESTYLYVCVLCDEFQKKSNDNMYI